MGVWVFCNYVENDNGSVTEVEDADGPDQRQIIFLNDIIFIAELRKSLFEITGEEFDVSFFTKPYAPDYQGDENRHTSFTPNEVLSCIGKIRAALEKNGNRFIREYESSGVSCSYYSKILPEIEYLEAQAKYADKKGYELQISHS